MVLNIYRGRICSGRQYNHRWVRTKIVCLMDEMDEIRFRIRISSLRRGWLSGKSKLRLLRRKSPHPQLPKGDENKPKNVARYRSDSWTDIRVELESLQGSFPSIARH